MQNKTFDVLMNFGRGKEAQDVIKMKLKKSKLRNRFIKVVEDTLDGHNKKKQAIVAIQSAFR